MISFPKEFSTQDILGQYNEVFAPAETLFHSGANFHLAEIKFIIEHVIRFRSDDALLLNFLTAQLQCTLVATVTGGSGDINGEKQILKKIIDLSI